MNDGIAFAAWDADGVEFLTIREDGTIITRHHRDDGVLHIHAQANSAFPDAIEKHGDLEDWRAGVITLPSEARTAGYPHQIAVLCHPAFLPRIPVVFPFAPLSDEAMARLMDAMPQVLTIVHNSGVFGRSEDIPTNNYPRG